MNSKKLILVFMLTAIVFSFSLASVSAIDTYSWAGCGADNFRVYTGWTSLHTGTSICNATLSDTTTEITNCTGGSLKQGTTYWIEVCLDETAGNAGQFKEDGISFWKIVGFKGTWGGTSPTGFDSPLLEQSWDVDNDDKTDALGVDYWAFTLEGNNLSYAPVDADNNRLQIKLEDDKGTGNNWMVMKATLDSDAATNDTTYLLSQDKDGVTSLTQSSRIGITMNAAPTTTNITASGSIVGGGSTITIYANTSGNGLNDTEGDAIYMYCDDSTTPTSINTECTGGTKSDSSYPYTLTCTFAVPEDDTEHTEYCRFYDDYLYSSAFNVSYTTDSTAPTISVTSVAGDAIPSYFDTSNDLGTDINISGEAGMACRWSASDQSYTAMSNACTIGGATASCNITDAISQGFHTYYISCKDQYDNEHTSSDNLEVSFYFDYAAPTTSDNSNSAIRAPNYIVTISEADSVDSDPTTLYCKDTTNTCTPSISIDNGGQITFTSDNRGVNYLRYNSTDDAGNKQSIQSSTININELPVFTSATDNATTIKGGSTVNITTESSDTNTLQELTLYVCNSTSVSSSGCGDGHYCNTSSIGTNLSCIFTSETDSASHTWYAYLFDELGEEAADFKSGSYTTDTTGPTITVITPQNTSYSQTGLTFSISLSETGSWAGYSLNGSSNVTMTNSSLTDWSAEVTLSDVEMHNVTFYANDSHGNMGVSSLTYFTVDTTAGDETAPTITVRSPTNNSYGTSSSVLFNLTTDEDLGWAGYSLNGSALVNLDNTSMRSWNKTVTLAEGTNNITFYANDTSSNNNQGSKSITIYTDLNVPEVSAFSCNATVNDSDDTICTATLDDGVRLNYSVVSHNSSGSFVNSSAISLSGTSDSLSYTIQAGNTTPGGYNVTLYTFDYAGQGEINYTTITVNDDTFPQIENITYSPNTTDAMDPGGDINVNATITEDYNISIVYLMYKNSSASDWTYLQMDNNSALVDGSSSEIVYNATFTPQTENWTFQVNATDFAGNENVSSDTTINVSNDTSANVTTNIPNIKSVTYAQRSSNNSLGNVSLNNTGDDTLVFNVTVSPGTLGSRLEVNYTGTYSVNYSVASGSLTNVTIDVNTTSLTAGLYAYNITISSSAGTTTYEKNLNMQTSLYPYLVVSIDTYSANVTGGGTGISLVASVTNLGSQDATGVYLNWSLPSSFSVSSGSLARSLGTIPLYGSGTNTITISIPSSAIAEVTNINATATASNADSSNDSKGVTIGSPTSNEGGSSETPNQAGGSTGTGGTGGITYAKTIEIVRGQSESFEVEVENSYLNTTLEDLTLEITGFLSQYITITKGNIGKINGGESKSFVVNIKIPPYKESYEEYTLRAVIKGFRVANGKQKSYTETQNIRLIIQDTTTEESNVSLSEAERAIEEMRAAGFNEETINMLLREAKKKLLERRNGEARSLAEEIIAIKEKAFFVDNLIKRIAEVINNPKKIRLLVSEANENIDSEYGAVALLKFMREGELGNVTSGEYKSFLTGNVVINDNNLNEMLELALLAFERGDYDLAEERANQARSLLLLNLKGNFGLFLYMYWQILLFVFVFISATGVMGYKKYQKATISRKIIDLDKEEENIRGLFVDTQKKYFEGKISSSEHERIMEQHQEKIVQIRKERITFRNKRITMLSPRQISQELEIEKMQVDAEVKKLQTEYYINKRISEKDYKSQFNILNERLAEIEGEGMTLEIINEKEGIGGKDNKIQPKEVKKDFKKSMIIAEKKIERKEKIKEWYLKFKGGLSSLWEKIRGTKKMVIKKEVVKLSKKTQRKQNKDIKPKFRFGDIWKNILGFGKKIIIKINPHKDKRGVVLIDNNLIETLKKEVEGKDCKGKWIKLNHKNGGVEIEDEK